MNPKYGYHHKTEKAEMIRGEVNRLSFSLILAMGYNGLVHAYIKDTSKEGVIQHDFFKFMDGLHPKLLPTAVVILDNAKIYTELVDNWFRDNDVNCFFLSLYSPDYNPIELVFGLIKGLIKKDKYRNYRLENAIQDTLSYVTVDHCQAFIKHAVRVWTINEPL
ncbi:hypothetical protein AKO1_002245 [Acrasis kona]|uniref:Tc1-like transposase DDE domain-containing protein n=1 Tax=Acrasis kona TaxID=1008807 RepID=A0AAW2YKE3_9EUKA